MPDDAKVVGIRAAQDAGLASGITNVSQQLSGAFGLAVLSTVVVAVMLRWPTVATTPPEATTA